MNQPKSQCPARLAGVHSQPGIDETTGDLDPTRMTWDNAARRFVNRQRARKLRRRGEQVIDSDMRTKTGRKVSMWFVEVRT